MVASAQVKIRRIRADDGPTLREIRLRALALDPTAFAASFVETQARPESHWAGRASESGSSDTKAEFLALNSDGTAVGLVGVYRVVDNSEVAELVAMWVEPALRGSGVAVQMIDAVLGWCTDVGVLLVELWVTPGNNRATRLYKRCGFEQRPPREGAKQYDECDTYLSFSITAADLNVSPRG